MVLKKCPACQLEKPYSDFSDIGGIFNKKRSRCRQCQTSYTREYERRRRKEPEYMARKRKSSTKQHNKLRDEFNKNKWNYLSEHPCVDCGETDPVVLDFDHKNPDNKKFTIAGGRKGLWETILKEIEKCDVRCANCHRRRTAKQLGWYPGLI